jgi:anti-sigma factor RsiW
MGMNLEQTVLRHPPRHELVAYAESLVDRSSSVSAFLAAHVNSCPRCTAEVRAIRASLEFTASASAPEPSGDLARQILAGAREVRLQAPETGRRHPSLAGTVFRAAVYVTATAALAVLTFGMAVGAGEGGAPSHRALQPAPQTAQAPETVSPDTIKRLAAAVSRSDGPPRTLREWERRRTVEGVSQDLSAAMAALDRNPGCARADEMVRTHLDRQVSGLRDLFVERTL